MSKKLLPKNKSAKKRSSSKRVSLSFPLKAVLQGILFFILSLLFIFLSITVAIGYVGQAGLKFPDKLERGFKRVKDLRIGDIVYVKNSGELVAEKIKSLKKIYGKQKVYNLNLSDGPSTYFANDFTVHNKKRSNISVVVVPFGVTVAWNDSGNGARLPIPAEDDRLKWAVTGGNCIEAIPSPGIGISGMRIWQTQVGLYAKVVDTITCSEYPQTVIGTGEGISYFGTVHVWNDDYRAYGIEMPDARPAVVKKHVYAGKYQVGWCRTTQSDDGCSCQDVSYPVQPSNGETTVVCDPPSWRTKNYVSDTCTRKSGSIEKAYSRDCYNVEIKNNDNWSNWVPERDGPKILTNRPGTTYTTMRQSFTINVDAAGTYGFAVQNALWQLIKIDGQVVVNDTASKGYKHLTSGAHTFVYTCQTNNDTLKTQNCAYSWGKVYHGSSTATLVYGVTPKNPPKCTIEPSSFCVSGGSKPLALNYYESGKQGSWSVVNDIGTFIARGNDWSNPDFMPRDFVYPTNPKRRNIEYDHDQNPSNNSDDPGYCTSTVKVYREPDFKIEVKKVDDCGGAVLEGVDGVGVNVIDSDVTFSRSYTQVTGDGGTAGETTFNVPLISSSCEADADSCDKPMYACRLSYQAKILDGDSALSNYLVCDGAGNPNWTRNGNYWVTDWVLDDSYNDVTRTLYVRDNPADTKWLTINQGNFTVYNDSIAMTGSDTDVLIQQEGSAFASGSISASLVGGIIGPNVYEFNSYAGGNQTVDIDKLFDLQNGGSITEVSGCGLVSQNGKIVHIYKGCNNLVVSGNAMENSNAKLIIIKNGNLTFNGQIDQINASFIVDGNVTVNTVGELNVNGFIWATGSMNLNKRVNINSTLEYTSDELNNILRDVIDSDRIYIVDVD